MQVLNRATGEIIDKPQILPGDKPQAKDDDRSRENKDFVMLYRYYVKQIADLGLKNPSALRVLLFLITNMDGTNAIGVTQELIAEMTHLAKRTITKAIAYLQENGWLEVFKLGRANVYVINPNVVWTSYADQKQYCKFQGTFMLSGEDNWELSKNKTSHVKQLNQLTPATIKKIADAIDAAQNEE